MKNKNNNLNKKIIKKKCGFKNTIMLINNKQ